MSQARPIIHTFASPEILADKLAEHTARLLQQDLADRGKASLVVSGGSTPKPFFRQLSNRDVDWKKIIVTLADERWVDPSDSASNEHLVRTMLLRNRAKAATFVPLKNDARTAQEGEALCEANLTQIFRPFSVVILGLGPDGHTASLFPESRELLSALDMHSGRTCVAVTPPAAPFERMTLTLPTLLDAKQIILHITGQEKLDVLHTALAGESIPDIPVRSVLQQKLSPVEIYWAP